MWDARYARACAYHSAAWIADRDNHDVDGGRVLVFATGHAASPPGEARELRRPPGRPLHGRPPPGLGRDGGALHRPAGGDGRLREAGRPQAAAAALRGEPARGVDVPRRGAPGRQAEPPGDRARLRRGRGRRPEVHRHGVHPRRDRRRHRQARAGASTTTCRSSTPFTSSGRRRPAWPTRTSGASRTGRCCASSTATSRRRTSWSATRARRRSSTSASRARRTSCARSPGSLPGQGVVHVARAGARASRPTTGRTSSRSASSCTS